MPNPAEIAVLTVKGQRYQDWETVAVTHQINDVHKFRFTCSEGIPIANNFAVLKIKPGDDVTIALAGIPAFAGKVDTRQVFYDANKHHIEIQGTSYAEVLAHTSVVTKTGEFKNIDFGQLARAICKPLGINFVVGGGTLPTMKFPRISIGPHQSGWEVIEQYARHVGVYLTSNPKGDLVALPGAPQGGGGTFVEGKNILEAREVIFNQSYQGQYGTGQLPPSDDQWGAKTTSVPFVKGDPSGLISGKGLAGTAAEIPAWTQDHLKSRVAHEKSVIDNDAVTVQVTVQGWRSSSGGGLWGPPRTKYTVTSPMLVANGMSLALKEVTFTQDNKTGTRSQITLCNDIAMNEGVPALSGSQVSGGGGEPLPGSAPIGGPGGGIGHA